MRAPSSGTVVLRSAEVDDDPTLRALLGEAGLPFEDVAANQQDFIVAVVDGEVAGCVGLEIVGSVALLRSLAVRERQRNVGLGGALFDRILARAKEKNLQRLFLLTTTASGFFARRGFVPIDRAAVPAPLSKNAQFARLCPSTAVCMALPL